MILIAPLQVAKEGVQQRQEEDGGEGVVGGEGEEGGEVDDVGGPGVGVVEQEVHHDGDDDGWKEGCLVSGGVLNFDVFLYLFTFEKT